MDSAVWADPTRATAFVTRLLYYLQASYFVDVARLCHKIHNDRSIPSQYVTTVQLGVATVHFAAYRMVRNEELDLLQVQQWITSLKRAYKHFSEKEQQEIGLHVQRFISQDVHMLTLGRPFILKCVEIMYHHMETRTKNKRHNDLHDRKEREQKQKQDVDMDVDVGEAELELEPLIHSRSDSSPPMKMAKVSIPVSNGSCSPSSKPHQQ